MKMDRTENSDGTGKYALLNLRKLALCRSDSPFQNFTPEIQAAIDTLDRAGVIEWGRVGEQDEFFVMKLKDINAPGGLTGYATKAAETDPEWASEVRSMLPRAGINSPFCKVPD